MKKRILRLFILFGLSLLLPSCDAAKLYDTFGSIGIAFIFLFLLSLLFVVIVFIYKKWKEHKAALSISQFNQNMSRIISKLDSPKEKIKALEYALKKICENKEYDRNMKWKNNLTVSIYLHLCNVYQEIGENAKIVDICSKIIELKPDHAKTYYNRGSIYCNTNKLDQALSDFNEAIKLDSLYAQSYNNRGFVYYKMGKYDLAIEDYVQALETEETPIVYYNRGNAYLKMNDTKNALSDYQAFLSLYTDNDEELIDEVVNTIKRIENQKHENFL